MATTSMKPRSAYARRARKAAERFLNRDSNAVLCPTKEFTGLREDLRAARKRVLSELPADLYEKVLRVTPDAYRNLLPLLTTTLM